MKAKFFQNDGAFDYTPDSAVSAGSVIAIAGLCGVANLDIAAGQLGALATTGIFAMAKVTGALSAGAVVGYDNDGDPLGGTAGSGAVTSTLGNVDFLCGTVIKAAAETDTTVLVAINAYPGSAILEQFPAQAAIADTADQTQADTTLAASWDATEAGKANTALAAIKVDVAATNATVDAILAVLRTAGLIAS